MESCFYCERSIASDYFTCPNRQCRWYSRRYMLCRGCIEQDACKFCGREAEEQDCQKDSDLASTSVLTPGTTSGFHDYSTLSGGNDAHLDDESFSNDTQFFHELAVMDRRLVVLFDLNETLLYRPWIPQGSMHAPVESAATVSPLPLPEGPTCRKLVMYPRPGASELLVSLVGRCRLGFVTSSSRSNAVAMIRQLLSDKHLQLDDDKRGYSLRLNGRSYVESLLLFDASHCENDGGRTAPFSVDKISQTMGVDTRYIVIVTSSRGKCRIPSCQKQTLLCSKYGADQVCDARENGLEYVKQVLEILLHLSEEDLKRGEVERRLQDVKQHGLKIVPCDSNLRIGCTKFASIPIPW